MTTYQNPHSETVRKAIALLKEYTSTVEGWNFTQEKDGVKLYNKSDSSPFVIVRGETIIPGHDFTFREVAAVANTPGCRKIWDEKFDAAELKKLYTINESLFWSKIKAPWPISPRDLSTASLREFTEDTCYTVLVSVEDSLVPAVSGCVRANLLISGWKISKTDAGIAISYITQVDLAGSIPTAFLKSVQLQVPLCAATVVKYLKNHGFPPFTTYCTAGFSSEFFDHSKKEFIVQLYSIGSCKWVISKKMYPAGVKVKITGGNASCEIVDGNIVLTGVDGPTTVRITKA